MVWPQRVCGSKPALLSCSPLSPWPFFRWTSLWDRTLPARGCCSSCCPRHPCGFALCSKDYPRGGVMSINLADKEHQSFWLFCVLLLQPEKKPKTHRTRNISSQFTLCSFYVLRHRLSHTNTCSLAGGRQPWLKPSCAGSQIPLSPVYQLALGKNLAGLLVACFIWHCLQRSCTAAAHVQQQPVFSSMLETPGCVGSYRFLKIPPKMKQSHSSPL